MNSIKYAIYFILFLSITVQVIVCVDLCWLHHVYLYIIVGEEYERLTEKLHLQSKCFIHLLILRGRLESITALNNPN